MTDARAYGTGLHNPTLGPGTTDEGGSQIGPLLANYTLNRLPGHAGPLIS